MEHSPHSGGSALSPADQREDLGTLVIGGGGYIGSHLVPVLQSIGRRVTVLGRRPRPSQELPGGAAYVQGDFGHAATLDRLLEAHREVVHLAYATVPNTSFDHPLEDLLQNLPPAVRLLSEAAARDVKLVLVSSGGTVYGEGSRSPIREDHPTRPISPYGVTKLTLENYAHLYSVTHKLRYVCVRPANAYGVGQRPFAGQGFISTALASALRNQPVNIYGRNGTIRDYLYVSDVASGIAAALDKGRPSETYNLGSGMGLSNRDVIEAIKPLLRDGGGDIQVNVLPERDFDVRANVLDSAKLQNHTGWKPCVEFTHGLRLTLDWLRDVHV